MRLQGLRPEAHAPTCSPSCAVESDYFKILKHTAKVVGRQISRGWGNNGKNKTKK